MTAGAIPTRRSIWEDYLQSFMGALTDTFRGEEFLIYGGKHGIHDDRHSYLIKQVTGRREVRRLRDEFLLGTVLRIKQPKTVVDSKTWAKFDFRNKGQDKFNLKADFYNPSFLRACSATLAGLNKKYGSRIHSAPIETHYT